MTGTREWRLTRPARAGEIEGYADSASVMPGRAFRLYVSSQAPSFTVTAYRMGWYDGALGRQVWRSAQIPGARQPAPKIRGVTRTVTASWQPSLTVGTDGWPAGAYLLKLTASTGGQRYVPITLRSASTAGAVVLLFGVMTWAAYNDWGGASLYHGPKGRGDFAGRSRSVSLDRPYSAPWASNGAELFLSFEQSVVARAERLNLPIAYETDIDVAREGRLLDGARAVVSMGHEEYWPISLRTAVETARDRGTNVAFLGANAVYWRARLGATRLGADRLVVAYKSATSDPLRADRRTTPRYRDTPQANPENRLTGMLYECFPARGTYRVIRPDFWLFSGTRVRAGSSFPGLVGVEIDRAYPLPGTPRPIEVVAHSPVRCHVPTHADSTYYSTPSGAGVFSVGTMNWVCALSGSCRKKGVTRSGNRFVAAVTDNLLKAFATGPVGRLHPARDNLEDLHAPTRNTTGAA